MQIILLERIAGVGQMGDEVRVRDGYARNFLLPQGKALRANEANRKRFEDQRAQLEARNLERRTEAESLAGRLDGESFVVVRQAAETGQLYGSVTTRDLAETITEAGVTIARNQIELNQPIKLIGLHPVAIALHPEVSVTITVNVARNADEAERQARGEDLTVVSYDDDEAEASEAPAEAAAEDGSEAAPDAASDSAEGEARGDEGEEPEAGSS